MSISFEDLLRDLVVETPAVAWADAAVARARTARRRRRAGAALGVAAALGAAALSVPLGHSTGSPQQLAAGPSSLSQSAHDYAQEFTQGDFTTIRRDLSPRILSLPTQIQTYPEFLLQAQWQDATRAFGDVTDIGDVVITPDTPDSGADRQLATVPIALERGKISLVIGHRDDGLYAIEVRTPYTPGHYEDFATNRALFVLHDLADGHYDAARAAFAPAYPLTAEQLRDRWQALIRSRGPFVRAGNADEAPGVVMVHADFAGGSGRLAVTFDGRYQLTSLDLS